MTDIHKISEITGLSVRTLKRIDKAGFLKVTKSADPITDAIRANLKKGNRLTAIQQLHLLRNPAAHKALEPWQDEIDAVLSELGDALAEGAPWSISARLTLASQKDSEAVEAIATWLRDFILESDNFDKRKVHDHAFLAVRLLANVPEHQIDNLAPKLTSCMWQCRGSEILRDFWHLEKGRTIYFRPIRKPLDL